MANRWPKIFKVAGAVNRFIVKGEERREAQQLAIMAALAYRPREAQTRAWEARIPADLDAPMQPVNDALAQNPRDAHVRAQQPRDMWAPIPGAPFDDVD